MRAGLDARIKHPAKLCLAGVMLLAAMDVTAPFSALPATLSSARMFPDRRRAVAMRQRLQARRQAALHGWACNVAPQNPPVDADDLPACAVYLYDETTRTHVYLVGSVHVSALVDGGCACVLKLRKEFDGSQVGRRSREGERGQGRESLSVEGA